MSLRLLLAAFEFCLVAQLALGPVLSVVSGPARSVYLARWRLLVPAQVGLAFLGVLGVIVLPRPY